MPQTTQIIPKWTFPHVETYINDYTFVTDDEVAATVDTSVKEVLAFISGKGIDNTWIKKSSRESAVKTFGESNFKLYGQPLMQALSVVDHDDTSVWMMRVMPENATYSNSVVSAYYKADAAGGANPMDRKFRIKLTAKSFENIKTAADLAEQAAKPDGEIKPNASAYVDDEGYTQAEIMTVRASGRGVYGDNYYLRIQKESSYEKEFGIKLYKFEIDNNESGYTNEANYVGATVTSAKYFTEGITLINDVLDDVEKGIAPVDIRVNEDNVEVVYDAYIEFAKKLHEDLITYYVDHQEDEVKAMIEATETEALPALDEFDIFYGQNPDSTTSHPGILFVQKLTDDVDVHAADYKAEDYSSDNVVDFQSAAGLQILNGSDGYFAEPRKTQEPAAGGSGTVDVQWTKEQEVEECYKNAFNGTYDKRILSKTRMGIDAIFDACYPYSVKLLIADLMEVRQDCRAFLDVGFVNTLSTASVRSLINLYDVFDSRDISVDIHNYKVTDPDTGKKCNVTISYFNAGQYADHINAGNFYRPMVKDYCQLTGHVRDSLVPVIDDYETELKEMLKNARLNYYEPVDDNVFQRAIQNTTQKDDSDCVEESNICIMHTLVNMIEKDANSAIYDFADADTRATFITTEKSKFENWGGTYVESFELSFATSTYEFNHQILHLYISIKFRGLNKMVIAEVDLNKRTQETTTSSTSSEE